MNREGSSPAVGSFSNGPENSGLVSNRSMDTLNHNKDGDEETDDD